MTDRNAIIEKIKALLSKTKENGCTEAEEMAALDKAAAMMDAYEVTDADLQLSKQEAAILHAEPKDQNDPHQLKWRLCGCVAQFCNVQIFRTAHETGLKVIGMPSDVQLAMFMLDHLADFVFGELYAHLIGCCAPRNERRTIIRSFVAACCDRIGERVLALVKRSEAARTSNGRELIVIKDAAVKAYMKEHNIRLRTAYAKGPSNTNEAAQAAGRAAGNRATFGRPVNGPTGMLRLGSK
jgi:hypothetical protein